MRAYNLFRSKGRSALYCAVPEEYTVPAFLTAATWEFSGRIDERAGRPFAFDAEAARTGVRYNGFHLFPCFEAAEEPSFH
jgi:hypothetical protein